MSGRSVLRVDKFLPQGVAGLEMHGDVIFVKNPPGFFRNAHNVRNNNVFPFDVVFFFLSPSPVAHNNPSTNAMTWMTEILHRHIYCC